MKRWQGLYSIWLSVLLFASYGLIWLSDGFEYSVVWFPLAGFVLISYVGYRLHRTTEEAEETLSDGVQTYFKIIIGVLLIVYTAFLIIFAVSTL